MIPTASDISVRQIVVLEKEPYWQPELDRQFLHEEFVVRGCRTIGDLDDLTLQDRGAMAVVDLSIGPASVLRWLARRLTNGPSTSTIVVSNEELKSLHWHARELGAVAVVNEFLGGHRLARLCRKSLDALTNQVVSETKPRT